MKTCLFGVLFFLAAHVRAADSYVVEGPAAVMAGDDPVQITIRETVDGGGTSKVRFIRSDPAVSVREADPEGVLVVSGPTPFTVLVGSAARAGLHKLEWEDVADPLRKGTWTVRVHAPVTRFFISPAASPSGASSVTVTIVALDERGLVATFYKKDVVADLTGIVQRRENISGETFQEGVARATWTLEENLSGSLHVRVEEKSPPVGRPAAVGTRDIVRGRRR